MKVLFITSELSFSNTSAAIRNRILLNGLLNKFEVDIYEVRQFEASPLEYSIPNEVNTLSADDTARNAAAVGFDAHSAQTVDAALHAISVQAPHARIVICGSLYLAGMILRQNG